MAISQISTNGIASSTTLTTPSINTINLTGGQIAFPATQVASSDANTLDDYEEGTWTPILQNESGGTTGITYTTQVGKYTKIGNTVILQFDILLSNKGTPGGSYVQVGGMPFSASGSPAQVGQGALWFGSLAVSWIWLGLQQNGGNAMYITGNKVANTGVAYPTFATDMGNSTQIGGTIVYTLA